MNSIHLKVIAILLIVVTLVNFSNMTVSSQNPDPPRLSRQNILAISDSDTNQTVMSLFNNRMIIDSQNLTIKYFDIQNDPQMNSLLSSSTINQKYDEIWIVTKHINDQALASDVILHLLSFHLPTLIWTSQLSLLSNQLQQNLNKNICDSNQKENSIFNFDYSQGSNLSSLLNQQLPTITSLNGSMTYSHCQLLGNSYPILNLTKIDNQNLNNMPILFQPSYKSNILISPFSFDGNFDSIFTGTTSSDTTTTDSIGPGFNSITIKNFGTNSNIDRNLLQNQKITINGKISNEINFANLLSILTYSMDANWTFTPSINSIFTNTGVNTNSNTAIGSQNPSILQTGFQFPPITPQMINDVAAGSLILGLISLIILLLRRYWMLILGFIIGIAAVFKVPTRKISVMDVYNNETRQSIMDIVNYRKGQGESVRNLSRELQIPLPTLLWHLQILEEFELIVKEKVKREVVIIGMDYIEEFDLDLKIFEMTFKSDKAKIFYDYLLNLREGENFTVISVVDFTQWSARTVIRYIVKLVELQIIETTPNKGYKIKSNYFTKLKELSEVNSP